MEISSLILKTKFKVDISTFNRENANTYSLLGESLSREEMEKLFENKRVLLQKFERRKRNLHSYQVGFIWNS